MGMNLRFSPLEYDQVAKKFTMGGNALGGQAYEITTTATPASGSCGVQFVFKGADGIPVTEVVSGICYIATNNAGSDHDIAATSFAVLTNGALTNIAGAGPSLFSTTTAGLLGVTITSTADDYWVVFMIPGVGTFISDVCTCNA